MPLPRPVGREGWPGVGIGRPTPHGVPDLGAAAGNETPCCPMPPEVWEGKTPGATKAGVEQGVGGPGDWLITLEGAGDATLDASCCCSRC
jgi:hypothetical protein